MTLMNNVFYEYLDKFVIIYLDDILIYSKSKEEHLQHLRQVLTILRQHKLYAKMKKCEIMQMRVEYLGHFISQDGISVDNRKIDVIRQWPTPANTSDVRSFLGIASYYRKFVKHFAAIAMPLTDLLHKNNVFRWQNAEQEAFEQLKMSLTTAPVLALPDTSKLFLVTTDASDYAIGAILS
jgi:RNase H-like domain found in reverse transcriptase/Reverse transcriptase (RNA-dependent DNA polymerase)